MLESLVIAQLGRLLKAAIALIARMTERQLAARMMVANVSPQTFDAGEISTALFTTGNERNKHKHSIMLYTKPTKHKYMYSLKLSRILVPVTVQNSSRFFFVLFATAYHIARSGMMLLMVLDSFFECVKSIAAQVTNHRHVTTQEFIVPTLQHLTVWHLLGDSVCVHNHIERRR